MSMSFNFVTLAANYVTSLLKYENFNNFSLFVQTVLFHCPIKKANDIIKK